MPGRALDQSAMRERFSHLRRKLTIFETQNTAIYIYAKRTIGCVSKIVSFRLRGEKRSLVANWSRALPGSVTLNLFDIRPIDLSISQCSTIKNIPKLIQVETINQFENVQSQKLQMLPKKHRSRRNRTYKRRLKLKIKKKIYQKK